MGSALSVSGLLIGVAVLVVVAVLVFALRGRQRHDWADPPGGPPPGPEPTGRAPYGAGAPEYPTAPPPAPSASMSEGVEPPPVDPEQGALPDMDPGQEPDRPRRIDDTQRFREQHRPDEPRSE